MTEVQLQPGDEELLGMCAPDGALPPPRDNEDELPLDLYGIMGKPLNFNMAGAVLNLRDSEVQFGPKIVASPSPNVPVINVQEEGSKDSVGVSASPLPDGDSKALHIKITPHGPVQTIQNGKVLQPPGDASLTRDAVPSSPRARAGSSSPRHVSKTVSSPIPRSARPDLQSPTSHPTGDVTLTPSSPLAPNELSLPPHGGLPTIVNSKIHNGTQIVITYNNCGRKSCEKGCRDGSCRRTASKSPVSALAGTEDAVLEFQEILRQRYRQRSRSPLLPWHLDRMVAPLEDYYLEPRIFSVDRRGLPTTSAVDLSELLRTADQETHFLVEGEAGMGKTLLSAHLAQEWAEDGALGHFRLVLLITLSDYQGSIEQYIQHEILPSYFDPEKVRQVWDYWRKNEKDILFILDGYDEMGHFDKCEVQNIIAGQDFPNSRVLVTSRPAALQCLATRLVVKGFDEHQMWKFIEKYFDIVKDTNCGESLREILARHSKYRKLAERPLFCVLLCMLYESDNANKELPDSMSDMLYKIMLCLIKWKKTRNKEADAEMDGLPAEYVQAFDHFGKLCVQAIKNDRHRFTGEDLKSVPHFEDIRQLGFLYNEDESDALRVQVQKFWKPVHQTFIEYLAALHIANHIRRCRTGCHQCWKFAALLEKKDSEVLPFTAGILSSHAHRLFSVLRYPRLQNLPELTLLALLKEAGPHRDNKRIIARLLDMESVVLSTNEAHIEGWTHLLPEKFYKLHSLELVWRIKSSNPDQESSFVEASSEQLCAFFKALHLNGSVKNIKIRAKQDGAHFTEDKLQMFFADIYKIYSKKGLKNLEFRDMKIDLGKHLKNSFEVASKSESLTPAYFSELRMLKLQTFLSNEDLHVTCEALASSAPHLQTLHLDGLELGHEGFLGLARLIKQRSSLHHLYLSMNKALLVNVFGSADEVPDFSPFEMGSQLKPLRLRKNAAQKSHDAFTLHEHDNETSDSPGGSQPSSPTSSIPNASITQGGGSEAGYSSSEETQGTGSSSPGVVNSHPCTELPFLFDVKGDAVKKVPQARHYWFIKGCETRLPLPLCVTSEHKSVFHYLFTALPESHLQTLNLDQPQFYLTIADLVCLGDAVRQAPHLKTLDLQRLRDVKSYMPILIALGQSQSMESVNFSSSQVIVKDAAFQLACTALRHNTSLKTMSCDHWSFQLQDKRSSIQHAVAVLSSWRVQDLSLRHCSVQFGDSSARATLAQLILSPPIVTSIPPPPPQEEWNALKSLNLAEVELTDVGPRRGPLLLPALRGFTSLVSLDLSASPSRPSRLDDSGSQQCFRLISNLPLLKDLTLNYWQFCLSETQDQFDKLCDTLRQCKNVRDVKLHNVDEQRPHKNYTTTCQTSFLHALVSCMPSLTKVSVCLYKVNGANMDEHVAAWMASCLYQHWNKFSFTLQVFGVSPSVASTLKNGFSKPFCMTREKDGPPRMLTLAVRRPVTPSFLRQTFRKATH
ncbi:P-loop containing nucleoside triphosphate hydrolase [Trinorchestia longiramus]|nr:P-loop containing nucleoside triphosphate hydrolase [Trinorchestia longiramus]